MTLRSAVSCRAPLVFATLCATACSLALTATPALAARPYQSQITQANGSALQNPDGLTVDNLNNLWVTEATGGGTVDKYSSSGTYEAQTASPPWSGSYIESAAFSKAAGKVFISDSNADDLWGLEPSAAYSGTDLNSGLGGGCCFIKVAADNTGGATGGDLYVSKGSGSSVVRIDGSGAAANFTAGPAAGTNELTGPFSSAGAIAVDSSGNLYVAGGSTVYEFEPSGELIREITEFEGSPLGQVTAIAVDPSNEYLLLAEETAIDEFVSSGESVEKITEANGSAFGRLQGLAVDSTGTLYAADGGGGVVDVFGPAGAYTATKFPLEVAVSGNGSVGSSPSGISCTAATSPCSAEFKQGRKVTLTAQPSDERTRFAGWKGCTTVNGIKCTVEVTEAMTVKAKFEPITQEQLTVTTTEGTGTGTVTGTSAPEFTPINCVNGTGTCTAEYNKGATVTLTATPNEQSVFTVWGAGDCKAEPEGRCEVELSAAKTVKANFAALPELTLKPVSSLNAVAATLNGHVSPAGGNITDCHFEYIDDTAYRYNTAQSGSANPWTGAQQSPCLPAPLSSPTDVSAALTGLAPGTDYHYRLVVVSNGLPPVNLVGQDFTTVGPYRFSAEFGSAGSGDGQLKEPREVAVDNSNGDIYVADTGNHRIVKFDSSGNFLAAWGWGVSDGNPASEVCTSGCHAGLPGSGSGQFESPRFVKVDNSGGPSAGDVYVADTADGQVQKFDPSGTLIASWGTGGAIDLGQDGTIGGITVGTSGDLFVLTGGAWTEISQDGTSQSKFSEGTHCSEVTITMGFPQNTGIDVNSIGTFYEGEENIEGGVSIDNPKFPLECGAYGFKAPKVLGSGPPVSGLVIDRSTSDLYVDHGTYINQYPSSNGCFFYGNGTYEPCKPSDAFGFGNLNSASGLAFNPSNGALYAANTGENDVAVFSPLPLPDVTTNPVTAQGPTSATLSGHVDLHDAGNLTDCHFEYGTDTTYSLGSVPCSQGTITGPIEVSAELKGLVPFTTYHYRLVASGENDSGLLSYGQDRSVTPTQGGAPVIDATSASGLAPTTATLGAQVNPNLAPTIYRFQYGTDASYGSQTLPSESIGEDGADHAVSTEITGLTPGTTYHFRVLAVNFNGLSAGPDRTFNTPDLPTVADSAASGVTQTTATLSAQVKPGFSPTTYRFEYGTTAAYGSSTPESASIGSDNSVHAAGASISGLAAATTYHFRVVATNSVGVTDASDQTFTTAPPPPTNNPPPATCKQGFVKKQGKCVKAHHKPHHKRHHHKARRQNRGSHQ